MTKAWNAVVTAKDLYLTLIEEMGAVGNGTIWPVLILATWWWL
jgi:hypothetical protein